MINNFEDFTEELNPDELKLVAPLMNGLRTKTKQNPIKAPEIVKAMNVFAQKSNRFEVNIKKTGTLAGTDESSDCRSSA